MTIEDYAKVTVLILFCAAVAGSFLAAMSWEFNKIGETHREFLGNKDNQL